MAKKVKTVVTAANLRQVQRRLDRLEAAVAKLKGKGKTKQAATPRKATRRKKNKPEFDEIPDAD